MNKEVMKSLSRKLIIHDDTISIVELCNRCKVSVQQVLAMVDQCIVEPVNTQHSHIRWRFQSTSIYRVNATVRLQEDLDVNLAGAALALELLDEIKELKRIH